MTTLQQAIEYLANKYPMVKIVDFDDKCMLVYDGRANMLFTINKDDLPIVTDYLCHGNVEALKAQYPGCIDNQIERVKDLQEKDVLLPGGVECLISTAEADVKAHIDYNLNNILMRKFVLETTQQCNFRCRYCHNTLEPVFRHHTGRQMTIETAKASIDFYRGMYLNFFNRLPDEKKALLLQHFPPSVGFYGGEPTLNWKLVEQATKYLLNCGWETDGIPLDKITLTVNTNLYVLTDEIMDYLLHYRPILYVSLDGPKIENDRNRVTADGKGTFDRVYSNLMRIKEVDEHYFAQKLMILCVEANGNDIESVHQMLDSIGCPVEYLQEQPYGCIEVNPEEQICYYNEHEDELIDSEIERYRAKLDEDEFEALDVFSSLFFLDNVNRDTPRERRKLSISLTCPLCVDNIMIDVDGDMHICHKTDGSLPLGNVMNGGYNMERMMAAYQSYGEATNSEACRHCWAIHECGYCAALRLHGGKWCNPRPEECDLTRRRVEYLLKLFVAIYKIEPDILPRLMQRKHDLHHHKSIVDYNEFIRL